MAFSTLACLLLGLGLAGQEQIIDAFDYSDALAAHRQWLAVAERDEAIQIGVVRDQGRNVLELPAPFASRPRPGRVYMDRKIELNLAAVGELKLEMRSSVANAGSRVSLYFHSGQGWYAAGTGLAGDDWQTLRFSKADFTVEGEPAGWHKIDTIRIAVWRGQPVDHAVHVRQLRTARHDVALVIPSAGSRSEIRTALQTSQDVGQMLSELGLGSDAVEDTAIVHGALGRRQVVILAYNPGLPADCVAAIAKFIEDGGKALVCYQLPQTLGDTLGFANPRYVRPENSGKFAEIRFDATGVDGLPRAMRQSSWNITTVEPAGFNARVIGQWFDEQGQPAGQGAMLLSDRGAFFPTSFCVTTANGRSRCWPRS